MGSILRTMRDKLRFTSQWTVRCISCGRSRDASEVGIVRVALPFRSWTLGRCSNCGVLRLIAVEPSSGRTPAPGSGS